jgi:[ribosomal protein S5]-alanine N-acetyltransferase
MVASTIRTNRLVLRQLVKGDAEALHPIFVDKQTMQYWWRAPHNSFEETEAAVALNAEQGDACTCWAITKDGEKAFGWINLREKRPGVAEVGYILSRDHWRQGFGKEALSQIIEHGFQNMKLRRIAADVDPDNISSIKLLRALGFVLEGQLRAEWATHIGVRDSLIFGLLFCEWSNKLI